LYFCSSLNTTALTDTLDIKIAKVSHSRLAETDFSDLPFGKVFTDHMFVADFEDGEWKNFQIVPYGPIPMSPAISALHYGQAIFEGMKAYKLKDGGISVFRADKNFERFNKSAERMAMPTIPESVFMQGISELINIDRAWVPGAANHSLYLRPVMFATDDVLGVKASANYKFVVLANPSGPYYNKALKVKIETNYTRADEGGVGYAKTAGNYGRSLYPFAQAQKEGFDQLIWTDAKDHLYVEESGTANLMFVIDSTLVTPDLRGTILDGVTRDTVITLARDSGFPVEERNVAVAEIIEGAKNGKLTDAFGAGTAATIAPVGSISWNGEEYTLIDPKEREFSQKVLKTLDAIRYGNGPDVHGWNYYV
jgi:branched-chain amino acid aminotransferase